MKFKESTIPIADGFEVVAAKLREAAGCDLTSRDVQNRLSTAIADKHRGTGSYAYYIDHAGDGESGDVVFSRDSKVLKAPYTVGGADGTAAQATVDWDNEAEVIPRTIYEEPEEEDEHYAAMSEAYKRDALYTDLPLYERFIPKAERDAADESDFAGKGHSFPILKPQDVQAAVHAMGRAGASNLGPSGIKARIIAIAKRKGWTKYLPKSWQNGTADAQEAARPRETLALVEGGSTFCAEIPLTEAARTSYPIKLISPGTGTRAYYPEDVLRRDGPKVFKRGTLMFWNHPTAAEEAARPEGNLDNLAAILTSDAAYNDKGPKGPGLYAEAKVMADYAQKVEERAPYIGLSIRGGGTGTGKTVDGKPVLASLDYAESVDYVTKAGRGGLALAEAARNAGILPDKGGSEMTEPEVQKVVEAATAPLRERALRGDAQVEAARVLSTITLPAAAKQRVIDTVLREALPKTADGELDKTKFSEAVTAQAKQEGEYLGSLGAGRVVGMGSASVSVAEAKQKQEQEDAEVKAREQRIKESAEVFGRILGNAKAGEAAARKGMVN